MSGLEGKRPIKSFAELEELWHLGPPEEPSIGSDLRSSHIPNSGSNRHMELSGSRRYAAFAFLDPSLNLTDIEQVLDKEFLVGGLIGINERVAQSVACSHEGLGLTWDILKEFSAGARFPGRTALLGMLGVKAGGHMEVAEYCLVFQQYQSLIVLLRAAFDAAAMMRFLSQDDRTIEEWIRLTAVPGEWQSPQDRRRVRRMEDQARKSHFKALGITQSQNATWQRRMFNMMAHPNVMGLLVTTEFADEGADTPLTGADARLADEATRLLERQPRQPMPRESLVEYDDPLEKRLRFWRAHATYTLFHVLTLLNTVTDVTGSPKGAELLQQCQRWRTEARRLLA